MILKMKVVIEDTDNMDKITRFTKKLESFTRLCAKDGIEIDAERDGGEDIEGEVGG